MPNISRYRLKQRKHKKSKQTMQNHEKTCRKFPGLLSQLINISSNWSLDTPGDITGISLLMRYYQFDKTTGDMKFNSCEFDQHGTRLRTGGKRRKKSACAKEKVASEASCAEVWEVERLGKGPLPFPSPQATDIIFLLLRFLL